MAQKKKTDFCCLSIFRSKDGAPLTPSPRQRPHVTGNTVQLVLDDIRKSDAGIYTVSARNPAGISSRTLELRVSSTGGEAGSSEDEPPAFLRRLNNDLSAKVGTRTRFLVEIRSGTRLEVSVCFKQNYHRTTYRNFQYFKLQPNSVYKLIKFVLQQDVTGKIIKCSLLGNKP